MSVEEELKIIENIIKHIQVDHPNFYTKIIVTGFKFLGQEHALRALEVLKECSNKSSIIAGFDLINHEDLSSPLL